MKTAGWLSVDDVVKHLGVRKETVYRWIAGRGLPAHKTGKLWLFRAEEVDNWVRGRAPQATPAVVSDVRYAAIPAPARDAALEVGDRATEREMPHFCRRPLDAVGEERLPVPAVGSVTCPLATAVGVMVVSVEVLATRGTGNIAPIGAAAANLPHSLRSAAACVRAHNETMALDAKWLRQVDLGVIVQDAQPDQDDGSAAVAVVAGIASVLSGAPVRGGLALSGGITERGMLVSVPQAAERARAVRAAGYAELLVAAADADEARAAVPELRVTAVSSCQQLVRSALSPSRMKFSMVERLTGSAQGRLDLEGTECAGQ